MILHFSYGMPGWMPPKKRVNLYIESTKKFLMNILKFDLRLDIYVYIYICIHIYFQYGSSIFTPTFFPLQDVVGPKPV